MTKPSYLVPASGQDGMTDLHLAAHDGDHAWVIAALREGCAVNARDDRQWTPLHWVAGMSALPDERGDIVRTLVAAGADIEARDAGGSTPLAIACRTGAHAVAEQLVEAGADVESVAASGWTPLMEAACYGEAATVTLLLQRNADPAAKSAKGLTALDIARKPGWDDVIAILTAAGPRSA